MKKSSLKTGMRVKLRDERIFLVIKDVDTFNYGHQDVAFVDNAGFFNGTEFKDDLTHDYNDNWDIVEVFNSDIESNTQLVRKFLDTNVRYSIWKRKEYTEEQKEIFKALKVLGFNWMARDKDNPVIAFDIKPERRSFTWYSTKCKQAELFTNSMQETFDFIKWEDEEPFEIPDL